MIKTIKVSKNINFGTKQFLHGLPSSASWDCNILHALLLTGYLTTPAKYRGFNLSTFWAWLRYAPAISPHSSDLRLRRLWSSLDAHQKTILSDDLGMGLPCFFLFQQFGFEDFADTNDLLNNLLGGVVSHAGKPARGPAKQPDFIAVDSNDQLHIIECKGTQTRGHLLKAMADGVAQKNNLSNGSIFASCMVGGLYIPQFDSIDSAEVVFIDPKPNERLLMLAKLPKSTILKAIRRQSFAKSLSVAGLWQSSTAISNLNETNRSGQHVRRLSEDELEFAGFHRMGNQWRKTIQYRTIEPNAEAEQKFNSRYAETLFDQPSLTELVISVPDVVVDLINKARNANGELLIDKVDDWLSSQTQTDRQIYTRTLENVDGNAGTNTKRISSRWSETSSKNSATLSTASGISFSLKRSIAK